MKRLRIGSLTLFVKMFILLFLSVSVPVGILGAWYFDRSSTQIEHVTAALLTENLQQNRLRIEQLFKQTELHSESIIGSRKLEVLDGEQEDRLFLGRALALVNELKGSYELTMYPADEARYKTYSALIGATPDVGWLHEALRLQGKGFWQFENDTFVYARLIRAMSDLRPLAVIKLSFPASAVVAQMISPAEYANLQHYLIDGKRQAILQDGKDPGLYRSKSAFIAEMPLEDLPWRLAAAIPEKDLIGKIEAIKRFSVVLVAVSIGLISMLLALITNGFVSPIKYVASQMRKVQMGQLVPSEKYGGRNDEIGQLARGYNSLIFGMQEMLATTKQMEAEKSQTEMQMLIHQINPHFLYNTLDAIKWRAAQVEEQTIADMVTAVSNLIRYSINNGEEFTTVEREIEHVKSYLHIESLRHYDSFQVMVNVQPRALNMPILKLIIQPLVENSVRHGIGKLASGQGKILVRVFIENEDLICVVEDNGPGCPEGEAKARMNQLRLKPGQTGGVGLYNANRRLNVRFGAKYGVSLANRENGGCKATIRHPLL
jgi:sensor histidine kinase YesM